MELITKEIAQKLPRLYETEHQKDATLWLKFFTPWMYCSWYVAEYDEKNRIFFGWVRGLADEWGYFSLNELEGIRGPGGLRIERDICFHPTNFSKRG